MRIFRRGIVTVEGHPLVVPSYSPALHPPGLRASRPASSRPASSSPPPSTLHPPGLHLPAVQPSTIIPHASILQARILQSSTLIPQALHPPALHPPALHPPALFLQSSTLGAGREGFILTNRLESQPPADHHQPSLNRLRTHPTPNRTCCGAMLPSPCKSWGVTCAAAQRSGCRGEAIGLVGAVLPTVCMPSELLRRWKEHAGSSFHLA